MILVADSGSTKTDWKLIDHGQVHTTIHTEGIKPIFISERKILSES